MVNTPELLCYSARNSFFWLIKTHMTCEHGVFMCKRISFWEIAITQEIPTSGQILIVILKLANGPVHHHA